MRISCIHTHIFTHKSEWSLFTVTPIYCFNSYKCNHQWGQPTRSIRVRKSFEFAGYSLYGAGDWQIPCLTSLIPAFIICKVRKMVSVLLASRIEDKSKASMIKCVWKYYGNIMASTDVVAPPGARTYPVLFTCYDVAEAKGVCKLHKGN